MILIGTAGCSIPRAEQEQFPGDGTHLERYAIRFAVAEINSSFHRSHRPGTWARWRDSVPASFRFSVKMPRAITHTRGLKDSCDLVDAFLEEVSVLESRLGAFLVQLPPKLVFDAAVAEEFFSALSRDLTASKSGPQGRCYRASTTRPFVVCEPRNESWFGKSADRLLQTYQVARVAADPARVPAAGVPGGWRGMSYYRLHGWPKMYYSAYDAEFIAALAGRVKQDAANDRDVWVIFDNTTLGAATRNARELAELLHVGR